jgi:hypothetical protein
MAKRDRCEKAPSPPDAADGEAEERAQQDPDGADGGLAEDEAEEERQRGEATKRYVGAARRESNDR